MIDEHGLAAGDSVGATPPRLPAWPRLRMAARVLGFAVSVALVAWVTAQAVSGVRLDDENLLPLGLSIIPALLSWVLLGRAWVDLGTAASTDDRRGPTAAAIGAWARSQALRYLPGALWAPARRAASVRGRTITKASAVVVEAGLTLVVGAGLGGVLMATGGDPWWALLLLVPVAAIVVLQFVTPRTGIDPSRVRAAAGWYTASWVAYAVSVLLTQAAVGDVHHFLAVAGAGSLARVVGMAVVFSPGGVGVREVAYVALVATFIPHDQAAAGAIASRLVLTVAELAVLVSIGLPHRLNRRESAGQKAAPLGVPREPSGERALAGMSSEPLGR